MFRSLSLDICLRSICNISRYIVDVTELVRFKVILYFFSFVFACCHHHLHYREKHNFSNTVSECTKTVRFQCEKVTCFQHHLSLKTKTLSLIHFLSRSAFLFGYFFVQGDGLILLSLAVCLNLCLQA